MLDSKYFKVLHTEDIENNRYDVVKPNGSPIILFSKVDGSPLASLHLNCYNNDNNNNAKSLFTKREKTKENSPDFQGIISEDNQRFEFVITNLSNDGYINFNILKCDETVTTVNPGGLNEVNELRPMESYTVQADQATNRALILKSIDVPDTNSKGSTTKLTVGQDEGNKEKSRSGTYYYLSVVPQISKAKLVERFKDTAWHCVDQFIVKRDNLMVRYNRMVNPYFQVGGLIPTGPQGPIGNQGITRQLIRGGQSLRSRAPQQKINYFDAKPKCYRTASTRSIPSLEMAYGEDIIKSSDEELGGDGGDGGYDLCGGDESDEDASFDLFGDDESDDDNHVLTMPKPKPKAKEQNISNDIVQKSYAAQVEAGEYVQVNSAFTGIEYSYDTPSTPCIVSLSVSKAITDIEDPSDEYILNIGKELIKTMINAGYSEMYGRLNSVYKETTCVICLDDEDESTTLDTVFYQCGHQCCHYTCAKTLTTCPMCRSSIRCKIKI